MAHHPALVREALSIPGPAGALEALLESPESGVADRVAVICHPHPLHQGTMQNKVVYTVSRAMLELGMPVLRFNFRGVGASEGTYDEGRGECEDAVTACEWLRRRHPAAQLLLAGFSFGGAVACRAALSTFPVTLVTIAPPVALARRLLAGALPATRWLLIQGEADGVVPPQGAREWAAELGSAVELILLPEVDHFFHGNLTLLRQTIVGQLQRGDHGWEAQH